jgi:hypothetical protein
LLWAVVPNPLRVVPEAFTVGVEVRALLVNAADCGFGAGGGALFVSATGCGFGAEAGELPAKAAACGDGARALAAPPTRRSPRRPRLP